MIATGATLTYDYPVEIIASGASPERPAPTIRYYIPPNARAATVEYAGFGAHFSKLKALAIDQALWPEGADPPTEIALTWAQLVMQQLQHDNLLPTCVVASAEGGIGICFVDGNRYADIECLNSGAILGVISNKADRPFVWEVEQDTRDIARASQRIREFIVAPETAAYVPEWSRSR